ncbi:transglutaminase family protein [Aquimarina sp. RZ0]|uniref:transglutaminase-like domain-containing protein n=1 Tax=Aquimarina sp. RZ0 TaxID=2607730 RepID=UPI0011F0E217|nr:transglutaminase family protein [Aquimarina sp. RZ0]KAA1246059.1 transglutaminase family protein [Aquimarina sp. RZ0]
MDYLASTYYFDYETDEIQEIIDEFNTDALTPKEKSKLLYLKIRDFWKYYPYTINLSKESYKASSIANKNRTHCVDKSILLIACLRALKIPARIHLAKVKNHIGVERLVKKFGTNELTPHGMVDLYLNGQWLKVSPAFNKELCRICRVEPLEFDGENDSIFQEFNNEGKVFMEYLEDYGHFEDVPLEFIFDNAKTHYPNIFVENKGVNEINL